MTDLDLEVLRPHLQWVKISHRGDPAGAAQANEFVHFIERCVASICARTQHDRFVEVSGLLGCWVCPPFSGLCALLIAA